jgi:Ran GTPase-activating protein (RanGAP) involved in mRNA processing and transport
LEWLNLADNDLGPKAAKAVVNAAETGKSITYLDLCRNDIGDKGARDFMEHLAMGESIRELRLGQNKIGPDGGEALGESLLTNTTLSTLHLAHNQLDLASILALFRATAATCTLNVLNLEHNAPWPPYEGNESLVQAVADCLGCPSDGKDGSGKVTCLKSLSLKHCNIRSSNVQKLFTSLSQNSTLEHLNMAWNGIRQVGALEIASMLAEPRCALSELDLRDNQLGAQMALSSALAHVFHKSHHGFAVVNTKLRILNLGNNEFTPNGMRQLAEYLPAFMGLEEFHIYHNPEIGVQGANAIARLLNMTSGMSRLNRLVISVCGIADTGVKAVAGALKGNERLTALDISGNGATDASMQALGEVITTNIMLKTLNISLNCIGHGGIQHLLDAATVRLHQLKDSANHLDIDVSSQADPIDSELRGINHEVMSMFTGLACEDG